MDIEFDIPSLGDTAEDSGPGFPLQSSAEDGERISAAIPIADGIRVEVAGAGFLRFDHYGATTGNCTGFSVGASWGKFGEFSGGVMDRAEAVRLAWEILRIVRINDAEYPSWVKEREDQYARLDEYMSGLKASPKP